MRTIKIIDPCIFAGSHVEPGTVLKNLDNAVAADLVASGRAIELTEAHGVLGRSAEQVQNGDPVPESRDPQPVERDPKPARKTKSRSLND